MTTHDKDKIIAAAKEAGFTEIRSRPSDADVCKGYRLSGEFKGWKVLQNNLERFYAIAFEDGRQAEREDCAKVCMQQCSVIEEPHEFERCADAIRARSTK